MLHTRLFVYEIVYTQLFIMISAESTTKREAFNKIFTRPEHLEEREKVEYGKCRATDRPTISDIFRREKASFLYYEKEEEKADHQRQMDAL